MRTDHKQANHRRASRSSSCRAIFVTGTDTDCGKTVVTLSLMRALARAGHRVAGFKPVAAGAERTALGLRNDDALAIRSMCTSDIPYERLNPYCFEPAIAPHIAAAEVGIPIRLEPIVDAFEMLCADHDWIVVEGAGGWRVPLSPEFDLAGLAAHLGLPVLMVVALRLGCLNHAALTRESIRAGGSPLHGWVANAVQHEMPRQQPNLDTLHASIDAPCLGELPYRPQLDFDELAAHLDLLPLLETT